jgi:cobalt-zinc-cadmium efflux system membrane fusion protein
MNMTINTSRIFPVLVSAALLFSGCKDSKEGAATSAEPKVSGLSVVFDAQSPAARRVLTAAVETAHATELVLPARIVWDEDHTSHVIPPVAGRLVDVTRAGVLGAMVTQDEILAHIQSPEVATAQAELASARAALVQAEKNYTRVSELVADKGAAVKDLEQAKTDLDHTRAEAARAELHLQVLGVNANAVDQQLAVRSPIAGVVVERNTNVAMQWRPDQAGGPLFTVTDPTFLWCQIDVPEKEIDKLRTGLNVTLHSSAWPQENFAAVIDNIGDSVDVTSRTVKVRAHLRNQSRHLKNEMYVTASLVAPAMGTLDIPAKAVFLNKTEQQVFVKAADGKYARRTIEPVAVNESWVSIAQGLDKGEEVVVDGALYLEKIIEAASAPSTADKTQQ